MIRVLEIDFVAVRGVYAEMQTRSIEKVDQDSLAFEIVKGNSPRTMSLMTRRGNSNQIKLYRVNLKESNVGKNGWEEYRRGEEPRRGNKGTMI